jgi:hypothetical protein
MRFCNEVYHVVSYRVCHVVSHEVYHVVYLSDDGFSRMESTHGYTHRRFCKGCTMKGIGGPDGPYEIPSDVHIQTRSGRSLSRSLARMAS